MPVTHPITHPITPPSLAAVVDTPLPTAPATPASVARPCGAQDYQSLRDPLQHYFQTRLPLYRRRGHGGNYVLLWTDGDSIREQFFPTTIALYSWLVRPENKHLCGPQSVEYYVKDEGSAPRHTLG